jgi:hypothetical protein
MQCEAQNAAIVVLSRVFVTRQCAHHGQQKFQLVTLPYLNIEVPALFDCRATMGVNMSNCITGAFSCWTWDWQEKSNELVFEKLPKEIITSVSPSYEDEGAADYDADIMDEIPVGSTSCLLSPSFQMQTQKPFVIKDTPAKKEHIQRKNILKRDLHKFQGELVGAFASQGKDQGWHWQDAIGLSVLLENYTSCLQIKGGADDDPNVQHHQDKLIRRLDNLSQKLPDIFEVFGNTLRSMESVGFSKIEAVLVERNEASKIQRKERKENTVSTSHSDLPNNQLSSTVVTDRKQALIPQWDGIDICERIIKFIAIDLDIKSKWEEGLQLWRKYYVCEEEREREKIYQLIQNNIKEIYRRVNPDIDNYDPDSQGKILERIRDLTDPTRYITQDEMRPTLDYLSHKFYGKIKVFNSVCELKHKNPVEREEKKQEGNGSDATILRSKDIGFFMLHWKDHWLAFIIDNRSAEPRYIVFDSNVNSDEERRGEYIIHLSEAIHSSNAFQCNPKKAIFDRQFNYSGGSLQDEPAVNACGVFATDFLEYIGDRLVESPDKKIEDFVADYLTKEKERSYHAKELFMENGRRQIVSMMRAYQ